MQNFFVTLVPIIATIIEFLGLLVIIIAVARSFLRIIVDEKFNFILSSKDLILNNGIVVALEFFMAAEILKTLVAKSPTELFHVGILVAIRIALTFIVHWEIKQKEEENRQREMELKQNTNLIEKFTNKN